MNILSIDTSGELLSLALKAGDKKVHRISADSSGRQAELLVLEVMQILEENELTIQGLDSMVIVLGPGSFTGIRVGVAAVLGLASATNKKLLGVSRLEIKAWQAQQLLVCRSTPGLKTNIAVFEKSSRGRFIFQEFDVNICPLCEPLSCTSLPEGDFFVTGTGVEEEKFPQSYIKTEITEPALDAMNFALYKLEKQFSFQEIAPVYVFEPDAKLPSTNY